VLLTCVGQPISTTQLLDLIWDDDVPASGLNIIQKYVGALRRLLEPSLPARGSGSYLLRQANGYRFDPAPGMLDLVDFREIVTTAQEGVGERALESYLEALDLWRGPAGEGLSHGTRVTPIFAALNGEFLDTCVAATEIAVTLDQPGRMLTHLQRAASTAPFHEPVQASLITALAAAGQQVEALSVFGTVRARLAEELGISPGPALQAAHQRVLNPVRPTRAVPDPDDDEDAEPADGPVGRVDELRILRQGLESAFAGGLGFVLVEGEPGVGKSRLLEETSTIAGRRGALTVWGRCLEGDGTPTMWPWVQAIGTLLASLPSAERRPTARR